MPRNLQKFPVKPTIKPKVVQKVEKKDNPKQAPSQVENIAEELKLKAKLSRLRIQLAKVESNIELQVKQGNEGQIDDLVTKQQEILSEIEKLSQ